MKDIVIGIDLGTTNSLVAYSDESGPHIIAGPDGQRTLPSVVYIDPATGQATVGREARRQAVRRPMETVFSIKRLMGKGLGDVQGELAYLPYQVVQRGDDSAMAEVEIGGRRYSPQEISAMILAELKGWAEAHFNKPVSKAVITVPAYFDDAQRQATRDAGRIAGLEVLRIVNEPTAAALAYGLDRAEDATIVVYDLGGGTFDVSVLRIEKGVFRVLSTNGDTHLGGDDFDREIIALVQREIRREFGEEIEFGAATRQALRNFAEAVKIELSEKSQALFEVEIGAGRTYRRTLTRQEYLALIGPHVKRSLERCRLAMQDAGGAAERIDRVVMVGGATYTPFVREQVGEFFGLEAYTALNPMEVVALGAAVQGGIIAGVKRDVLLLDIIPLSLGIETMGGAVAKVIMKGTHIPCQAKENFSTYADGQADVKIHVLQGERELVKDCRSLGQFTLSGLPPMPAGIPIINVTFLVDANGILNVSALEQRSGTKAAIQIVPSYGLSRREVDKMVIDSLKHAREDMLEHRLVDLYNQIKLDTAAIEKSMSIVGDDVDPAYKQELTEIIEGIRGMVGWRDAEAIHRALVYMDRKSAPLAEKAVAKSLRDAAGG